MILASFIVQLNLFKFIYPRPILSAHTLRFCRSPIIQPFCNSHDPNQLQFHVESTFIILLNSVENVTSSILGLCPSRQPQAASHETCASENFRFCNSSVSWVFFPQRFEQLMEGQSSVGYSTACELPNIYTWLVFTMGIP